MQPLTDVPLKGENSVRPCPTCGFPVRIVRRDGGYADHYVHIDYTELDAELNPQDPIIAAQLRRIREGKRTLALVGMGPTSCSLAPFDDEDVEIWGLNESHAFPWMKRATGWFQLHPRKSFEREVACREVRGHFDWLKQSHKIPIYMQFKHNDIPDSVEYPLYDIIAEFFKDVRKGDERVKYFTSTFAFMMALGIYRGFERFEVYGFEMAGGDEYVPQRACAEFWVGMALGRGVEIYLPNNSQLLFGPLYGYYGQGSSNLVVERRSAPPASL